MVDSETTNTPNDPATARAGNGRLTAPERRDRILRAARSEFARVGYHGASTSAIAELAGCSEPMLYKHFAGKHDLFLSALRDSIAGFQAWFEEVLDSDPSTDAVRQALTVIREQLPDPAFQQLMRLRMLAVSLSDDDEVRATLAELDVRTKRQIIDFVERGIEQGSVARDVDPAYVAWMWISMMLGACYCEALEPGTFALADRYVERFIASLAAR
ncbi:MAG: TetR/AcrR family transcriptional regulator [Thermoleophilia bacterium]|nr:TetR/AcrR family transcriptional regulator [Thermoleophilia bacterium]